MQCVMLFNVRTQKGCEAIKASLCPWNNTMFILFDESLWVAFTWVKLTALWAMMTLQQSQC